MDKICLTEKINKKYSSYCGIYIIYVAHHTYIGSTANLQKRISTHRRALKANKKENQKFINAFNKYGIESCYWQFIESCSEDQLLKRETYWIKILNPDLNIIRDPETVQFRKSAEELNNNSVSSKKVYQYDLNGNFLNEYPSCSEAARQLKLKEATSISQCARGNTALHSVAGYQWSYEKTDFLKIYTNYSDKSKIISVYVFNCITGEEKKYDSIADACRDISTNSNFDSACATLSCSCSGRLFFEHKYIARYEKDQAYILTTRKSTIYDSINNLIYKDAKEAAKILNISRYKVKRKCNDASDTSLQYMVHCAQEKLRESGKLFKKRQP